MKDEKGKDPIQAAEELELEEEYKDQADLMCLIDYLQRGRYFVIAVKRNFSDMEISVSSERQIRRNGQLRPF